MKKWGGIMDIKLIVGFGCFLIPVVFQSKSSLAGLCWCVAGQKVVVSPETAAQVPDQVKAGLPRVYVTVPCPL